MSQALVSTEWLNKSAYILKRHVDFIPYHGSIDNLKPNQTTIHLAQAPIRKTIAQKIQAMHNSALTNLPITKKSFNCTMQPLEKKLDGKLVTMVSQHRPIQPYILVCLVSKIAQWRLRQFGLKQRCLSLMLWHERGSRKLT